MRKIAFEVKAPDTPAKLHQRFFTINRFTVTQNRRRFE